MKKSGRKAISDIISTLLMMAITVVGATLIFMIFQNGDLSSTITSLGTAQNVNDPIVILGYDTRDGTNLYSINGLNNNIAHKKLCTVSCVANQLPSNGGTDFITLRIQNKGSNSVILQGVLINLVSHVWDATTANVQLTVSYPGDGKFSIVSPTKTNPAPTQMSSSVIGAGQDVLLVIKLSNSINPDISLSQSMTIVFNTGSNAQKTFVIPSGDAS